ncbi:MAG TPA: sulfotransferase [Steroidobacteraceae bacterium]|jgi:tetratricopeptide (TPR) repeat protein|nr:sulfotransferase [Steroidobacteraceae bacterium]
MILAWLDGREATEIGFALADEYAPRTDPAVTRSLRQRSASDSMEQLLRRADTEVRPLQLNFYKKAKFANSFKWRLIENGVAREVADEITQSLVLHLSRGQIPAFIQQLTDAPANRADRAKAQHLFSRGNKLIEQGAYAEAATLFEEAVKHDSSHAEALNNLGSSLSRLGRYEEAEQCFREAMAGKPNFSDPHANLGVLLRQKGYLSDSETYLRRALKLRPTDVDARINLGLTLVLLGHLRDAKACFAKVLKTAPRNVGALFGMGQIAMLDGRFEDSETTFRRILEFNPKSTVAWAALALTRKMTNADCNWLEGAERLMTSAIHPMEEANLRFAMGKYCDDVNDFSRAFQNYRRGNELLKAAAQSYDRKGRSHLIDQLMRIYPRAAISNIGAAGSLSAKPVFVVGMPRSGTSLAEQIISSHSAAYGIGELDFWNSSALGEAGIAQGPLSEAVRPRVAEEYLRILEGFSKSASRVINKTPANSDFLGLIYSVFPNARVIYMQRNPIDTCLSCYFQQFLAGINFGFDLTDLAHYYREHRRIMAHWRAVLPPGFILEVPYEELVVDQETWSRKMLDFIGLEWEPGCLEFHTNKRQVITASAWQVRQKIYQSSVARRHNYEKFIGPVKSLEQ